MTVVATLLLHDVPIVIGDTVLLTNEEGVKSIAVPTVESLPELKRPISGFCRKVYIIQQRLAVAWTGSRLAAEETLQVLRAHMREFGVCELTLTNFLQGRNQEARALKLIGWIAESKTSQPRSFWWSAQTPAEIVFDEQDVEGIGEPLFRNTFGGANISSTGGGLSAHELASAAALAGISRLLTIETTAGLTLQHGFGFCYDIVVWCGYRFRYVRSYTQLNIDFTYDSKALGGRYQHRPTMLVYQSLGQSAAFAAMRLKGQQNLDGSFQLDGLVPVRIPPLWDCDETLPKVLSIHSEYICAFLHIVDELGRSLTAPFCITREAKRGDGMWISKIGKREVIEFNTGIVTAIHQAAFPPAPSSP